MTDNRTIELLPCPFCGGEAETLTAESMYGGYLFGIMCNDCRSRGDVYDNEAEAIAAWNSRAERTCNLKDTTRSSNDDYWNSAMCSECSAEFTCGIFGAGRNAPDAFYCPNCGAKVMYE